MQIDYVYVTVDGNRSNVYKVKQNLKKAMSSFRLRWK